jgi:Arc/MetJ-type ribon-helix-helix transcriptional regulator
MAKINQKVFYTPPEMAKAIEEFRFSRRFNSEAEAIRVIVSMGLEALKEQAKEKEAGKLAA